MNGNDDDSPEGIISSEPALLDPGKDYIDPERIKKWENEEMLDSTTRRTPVTQTAAFCNS